MSNTSSTIAVPETRTIPRHIAIIMDGNGRWARQRFCRASPVIAAAWKMCAARCGRARRKGVEFLTLFAFSSENWRRPADEVSLLMQLFVIALEQEVAKLHENNIRFKVIGDLSRFESRLTRLIADAEQLTRDNTRLTLTVAANYGGRWDMIQAVTRMLKDKPQLASGFAEVDLSPYLSLAYAPEPDLFIRTGGEQRISNFLLWQLAYTEMYFTDTLWPDFDTAALDRAIVSYQQRERRFGRTSEQLQEAVAAESTLRHASEGR